MTFETVIKLDIDSIDVRRAYKVGKGLAELYFYNGLKMKGVEVKSTRKGFHVRVILQSEVKLTDSEVVFIQLFLGSDKYRELRNLRRILLNRQNIINSKKWNALFTVKNGHDGVSYEKDDERAKEFKEKLLKNYEQWIRKLSRSIV